MMPQPRFCHGLLKRAALAGITATFIVANPHAVVSAEDPADSQSDGSQFGGQSDTRAATSQAAPESPNRLNLVLDIDNHPLPGATLRIGGKVPKNWSAVTDADGHFPLPGNDAVSLDNVAISAPGFASANIGLHRGRLNLTILHRLGRLEGKVLDGTGKPLAGAPVTVDVREHYPATDVIRVGAARATSDASGHFVLNDIPPGDAFVSASSQSIAVASVKIADGKTIDNIVLDLSKSNASVDGRVVDPTGASVRGARIKLGDIASGISIELPNQPTSDAHGFYSLRGLPVGLFTLTACINYQIGGVGEFTADSAAARVMLRPQTPVFNLITKTPPPAKPEPRELPQENPNRWIVRDEYANFGALSDNEKNLTVWYLASEQEFPHADQKSIVADLLSNQGIYANANAVPFTCEALQLTKEQKWIDLKDRVDEIYRHPRDIYIFVEAFECQRALEGKPVSPEIKLAMQTIFESGYWQTTVTDAQLAAAVKRLADEPDREMAFPYALQIAVTSRPKGGTKRGRLAGAQLLKSYDAKVVRARLDQFRAGFDDFLEQELQWVAASLH